MQRSTRRSNSGNRSTSGISKVLQKARQTASRKTAKKRGESRLRVEALERRDLMAADFLHNPLIAQDVNGDFRVTPLDALSVINHLNRQYRRGVGSGEGEAVVSTNNGTTSQFRSMLDVNDDSRITPLDVLSIINKLNNPEGETILAEVRLVPIDSEGNELASSVVDGVTTYIVGMGQDFSIRTQILDNRGDEAEGTFSGYLDIEFENLDGSPNEKVGALYGELQTIELVNVDGGTFTLNFGGQVTAPITVARTTGGAINRGATANNIVAAIGALPFAGGANNILIEDRGSGNDATFLLNYINDLVRTDVPNPTVQSNLLTAPNGTPTITVPPGIFDPSNSDVFFPAMAFPVTPQTTNNLIYGQSPLGTLVSSGNGQFTLDEIGSSLFFFSPLIIQDPDVFINIFDVKFRGTETGVVEFSANVADLDTGIALLGFPPEENVDPISLPPEMIQFPTPFRINVIDRIQAVNDVFPAPGAPVLREDLGPFTLTNVTGNDIVLVGELAGIQAVSNPGAAVGTVSFTPGGNDIVFNPAQDFFGEATFTYTVVNTLGDTSVGTVTINVTPVNDPPIPRSPLPTLTIEEDSTTPLTVAASEVFLAGPGGETGAVSFVSAELLPGEAGGSVQVVNGQLVFTPAEDFNGLVRLNVVAADQANLQSAVTRVNITVTQVNDAPAPLGPTFTTNEDTNLVLAPSSLFGPGAPFEEQSITLSNPALVSGATGGVVLLNANGNLVFRPDENFFGDVDIVVTGTDNGTPNLSTTGTFTIRVIGVNDAPTANPDSYVVFGLSGTEQELLVLENDSAGPNEPITDLRIVRVLNQSGTGNVRIAANGRSIFYTPPAGVATGTDAFTYEVTDLADTTGATTSQARVTIDIVPPVLPFALRDVVSIVEGATAPLTINVLANDFINDGEQKRLLSFTQPASGLGTVTLDPGTNPDSSDDRLVYTVPSENFFGEVIFTYTMVDTGDDSEPSVGQVTVTVTAVNDAPTVVQSRTIATTEDVVNFRVAGTTLLEGSSAGPLEGDQTVSVTSARIISGGGTVNVQNGDLFFSPAANRVNNVVVEFTATDDGTTNGVLDPKTATGRVTFTIAADNDAPETGNDTATTPEDVPVVIQASQILSNDRPGPANAADETANQTLSITAVRVISGGGTATIVGGNVRYAPATNVNGVAVLEYTITDAETVATPGFVAKTATGRITVTITEVNDNPAALTATRSAFAGLATNIDLTAELAATSRGATNEASQTLRINRIIPGSAVGGVAVLNANGTITFTATAGSSGTATFQIETIDNGTTAGVADPKTGVGTVNVQVAPFQPSTISGVVWIDDDSDNVVDSDENRLSGVTVVLTGTTVAAGGGAVSETALTKADGSYSFGTLPPGTYTVRYVQPMMTVDGPSADSVTRTIAVPGGSTIVANFSVLGTDVEFASILDNLAAGYFGQFPHVRGKGIDAVVGADGTMAFSTVHGGYGPMIFAEVTLSPDSRDAFLTIVGTDLSVKTAAIPRGKFFIARDSEGNTMVKIVALESELNFFAVSAAPTAAQQSRAYMDSVDAFFAQLN